MTLHSNERLIVPGLVAWLTLAVLIVMAVPQGIAVASAVTTFLSFFGLRQAVGALIVLLLLRVINPGLSPVEPGLESIGVIALLLCSARIWMEVLREPRVVAAALPKFTLLYAAVIFGLSLVFSPNASISVLKAINFFIPMGAVVVGIHVLAQRGEILGSSATSLWAFVIALSIPTLAIPSIGYLRDGQGFQGILNHPQALAVFLGPVVITMLIKALTLRGPRSAIFIGGLVLSAGALWLTRGRTGFAAIMLSFVMLLIFRKGFRLGALSLLSFVFRRPWAVGGLLLLASLLLVSETSLITLLIEFIFKGSGADRLSDAYDYSRGFIVDQAIANFESNPLAGIGFGISNSFTHAFNVQVDPLTGLPVGAATEKANLVLAVIEETGVIGSLAFLLFILSLLRRIALVPDLAVAWCAMAALCTNVSEVTFFSFGGIGLYTWLLMGWALAEQARSAAEHDPYWQTARPLPIANPI